MQTVSVVIPHWNDSDGLVRALRSVRGQSLRVSTTIVVDDYSDTGEFESVRSVICEHKKLGFETVLIRNERGLGPGASRNRGWDVSSDDLVAFLDSDDEWHPQKLELQMPHFESDPELALCCHRFGAGEWDEIWEAPDAFHVSPSQWLTKNWAPTPTVMVRSDLTDRFAEDRSYAEDYELWLSVALSGRSTRYLDARLARPDKPSYGASGLSAKMISMETGELTAINRVMSRHGYPLVVRAAVSAWSVIKFARRLAVVSLRRVLGLRSRRARTER